MSGFNLQTLKSNWINIKNTAPFSLQNVQSLATSLIHGVGHLYVIILLYLSLTSHAVSADHKCWDFLIEVLTYPETKQALFPIFASQSRGLLKALADSLEKCSGKMESMEFKPKKKKEGSATDESTKVFNLSDFDLYELLNSLSRLSTFLFDLTTPFYPDYDSFVNFVSTMLSSKFYFLTTYDANFMLDRSSALKIYENIFRFWFSSLTKQPERKNFETSVKLLLELSIFRSKLVSMKQILIESKETDSLSALLDIFDKFLIQSLFPLDFMGVKDAESYFYAGTHASYQNGLIASLDQYKSLENWFEISGIVKTLYSMFLTQFRIANKQEVVYVNLGIFTVNLG